MTTARDIITFALKKSGVLGVGRPASADDISDGLADFNDMLALWNRERWMVWDQVTIEKVATGALTYTAGPGGDYNITPRPNRIKAAYIKILTYPPNLQVRQPVTVVSSQEEWDRIALPSLISFTQYVFLQTAYPLAIVNAYPVPQANLYALGLSFADVLPVVTLNTDMSTVPAEYLPGMKFNLARWYRQAYGKGMKPDTELNRLATYSLNVIKNANLQIPELVIPKELTSNSPGYNILSDQF